MYLLLELNCDGGSWDRVEGSFLSGVPFLLRGYPAVIVLQDENVEEVISWGLVERSAFSVALDFK